MVDKSSKTTKVWFKKEYDEHVRFKPRFAGGDYVFVEHPRQMTSAADNIGNVAYLKLLSRRIRPFRVFSVGSEYVKVDEVGTKNTV